MSAPPIRFNPARAKLVTAIAAPEALYAMAFDGRANTVYGAGMDGHLHVVDLKVAKPMAVRKGKLHDNYVSCCALRGGELISGGYDRCLVWTELATGNRIRSVSAHDGWVRKLALTPDGRRVVSVGDDMRVNVHDASSGKRLISLTGHAPKVPEGYLSALYALAVSTDGKWAASGDRAGFVRVWELATGKTAAEFRAAAFYTFDEAKRARAIGGVRGLAFSPDGSRLAVSGIGLVTNVDGFVGPCRVELWDWKAAKRTAVGEAKHQAILNHVAFGPGPWLTAVGGGDGGGAIVCWNPAEGGPIVLKPKGHLHGFAYDAAGARLVAAGHGGFQVWQMVSA
jgi:WD40 repeat protein